MNEHELSEAFKRILPEQPSAKGWAGKARQRRHRQRAVAGAAAVAVVAVVAIPLGLSLGSSPQLVATPAPTTRAQPEHEVEGGVPAVCQKAQEEYFDRTDPADGKLPQGATRMWLCGGDMSGDYGDQLAFIGPQDALTVGVDEAVTAFNDLTWREGVAVDCGSQGEVYHLLVEYPDGAMQILEGNFAPDGCQHFDMTGGIVEGADDYLGTLQGLWEAQRASDPPVTSDADACPGFTSVFHLDRAGLGRGFGCVVQRDTNASSSAVHLSFNDLPEDLLATIRDGFPTHSEPLDRYSPFTSDEQVVLQNDHGDPLTLYWGTWGGTPGLAWNNPQRLVWYPDEALAKRLDEHFAQLKQEFGVDPEPSPGTDDYNGLTSKVCADIQDKKVPLGSLGRTEDLPTGAERVWLCGDLNDPYTGALGPREALVTDPDRVVRAINALDPGPEGEIACTEVGGLTFHLAVDYPDGERRILAAETVNCEFVGERVGGRKLLEQIRPMWDAQRAAVGAPDLGTPDLCDTFPTPSSPNKGYWSFLPVESRDAVTGVVCGLAEDAVDFDGPVLQRWLPAEVVTAISEADAFTADEWQPSMPDGLPYLVLLNEFGDPLTVDLATNGEIVLPQGRWKPDDQTAALLRDTLSGLLTKPFYEQPQVCYADPTGEEPADLGEVISGVACLEGFVVPDKGPELDPDFAAELGRRFDAESVPMQAGGSSIFVLLQDAAGRRVTLHVDSRHAIDPTQPVGLANEAGDRVWELPRDVQAELELYGFDFAQQ